MTEPYRGTVETPEQRTIRELEVDNARLRRESADVHLALLCARDEASFLRAETRRLQRAQMAAVVLTAVWCTITVNIALHLQRCL